MVIYLLQNYNKLSANEFKGVRMPHIFLDERKLKMNSFVMETVAQLAVQFKFELDVNINALNNAPSLRQGILEAMVLLPRIQKSMLRHSSII